MPGCLSPPFFCMLSETTHGNHSEHHLNVVLPGVGSKSTTLCMAGDTHKGANGQGHGPSRRPVPGSFVFLAVPDVATFLQIERHVFIACIQIAPNLRLYIISCMYLLYTNKVSLSISCYPCWERRICVTRLIAPLFTCLGCTVAPINLVAPDTFPF